MQLLDVPPGEESGGYMIKASAGKIPGLASLMKGHILVLIKSTFLSFCF
jgi:hypothetical protein